MGNVKMCRFSCPDGTYSIPRIESETDNRVSSLVSPLWGRRYYEVIKMICNEGEDSIKDFGFSLFHVENIHTHALEKIFLGIYKVGLNEPVWQYVIEDESWYRREKSFKLEGVELDCGRYFILLGNIKPDKNFVPFMKELAGCYRLDFVVIPNGLSLGHPRLLEYGIRYIAPEERGMELPYHYPNYLLMMGDFPLYGLNMTLDSVPDIYMDKYDLRIFDEGLACVELIEDVLHGQKEEVMFVPPRGVPHGMGHYILYHNGMPLVHFQCHRKKRLGLLKMEEILTDSIYWHLHRYKSLQLYGCKEIKKKICTLLNNPEMSRPQSLSLSVDYGNSFDVSQAILSDLYQGVSKIYVNVDDGLGKLFRMSGEEEGDFMFVWNLDDSSDALADEWVSGFADYVKSSHGRLLVYGASDRINFLLEQSEVMARLIPRKNRWHTQPFTKMERLYLRIYAKESEGDNPNFDRYEKMYDELQ